MLRLCSYIAVMNGELQLWAGLTCAYVVVVFICALVGGEIICICCGCVHMLQLWVGLSCAYVAVAVICCSCGRGVHFHISRF